MRIDCNVMRFFVRKIERISQNDKLTFNNYFSQCGNTTWFSTTLRKTITTLRV